MGDNNIKTLSEIKKEVKKADYEFIEKFATISDDKKSLLIRIPQEIRNHFGISPKDKIRFYAEFREDGKPKLEIKLIKNVR